MITSNQDHSLQRVGVSREQALPESIYARYANARNPAKGKKQDIADRMRNLFRDH